MSFPRYPRYKDSGVEWLGEVPEHWNAEPLKHHLIRNDGGVWGADPTGENDTIVLRSTEQTVDGRWRLDDPATRQLSGAEIAAALLLEGDLVVTKSSGSSLHIGKTTLVTAEIAELRCCYSNFMQRLRTAISLSPRLLWYIMNSIIARDQLDVMSSSSTGLANINSKLLDQLLIAVPPQDEQVGLLAFLDRETATIDELITEQQRLIELLKEKRQAVISHAVTRGLNPDAPMKPSGVEWLGDVPAHWEVQRVKTVSTFITSGPRGWSERVGDDGALFIQSGDLDDELRIRFAGAKRVRVEDGAEATRTKLLNGDVVVCITGAKTGNVAVCAEVPEDAYVNQHLCLVRSAAEIHSAFLGHLLKSDIGQSYFSVSQYGLKQGLSLEDVREAPVLIPPMPEQEAIVEYISLHTAEFSALLSEVETAIVLLQERRTTLISAAVTGKIDVRRLTANQAFN